MRERGYNDLHSDAIEGAATRTRKARGRSSRQEQESTPHGRTWFCP